MQDISEQFKNFVGSHFPTISHFPKDMSTVYVVFYIKGNKETPVYVGETESIQRRIGEYVSASFTMHTDFKVGEAIRYFQERGHQVIIRYKATREEQRKEQEKKIKTALKQAGYKLLDELPDINMKLPIKKGRDKE